MPTIPGHPILDQISLDHDPTDSTATFDVEPGPRTITVTLRDGTTATVREGDDGPNGLDPDAFRIFEELLAYVVNGA